MKKYYKFIFMALFGLFIFLPKDTFAISFTESGYSCYYAQSGEQICSNLTTYRFDIGEYGIGPLDRFDYSLFTAEIKYAVIDFYNQSFCSSEGTGGTFKGWLWFNNPFANTNISLSLNQGSDIFNCTTNPSGSYGLEYNCVIPKSFSNKTLTYTLKPKAFDSNTIVSPFTFGVGTYTNGTQTCVVDSSLILENDNKNTNKIIESNEEIKKEQEKTNEELGELNDNLTSEEAPDLDALEDTAGWLPPGPVDSILNLPLTFFNNLISNLSKTCQPVDIPLPYVSKSLTLPCISTLYEQIGATTFLNWVGLIVGTIILYNYFLNLYKWIDDTIQMKDNSVDDWGGV